MYDDSLGRYDDGPADDPYGEDDAEGSHAEFEDWQAQSELARLALVAAIELVFVAPWIRPYAGRMYELPKIRGRHPEDTIIVITLNIDEEEP